MSARPPIRTLVRNAASNPIGRNSFFLGLSGVSRALGDIVLIVLVIRTLDPSTAGHVIIAFTIIRIAQFVVEGGLGGYLVRELPRNPSATAIYTLEALKLVAMVAVTIGIVISGATAPFHLVTALAVAIGTVAITCGAGQRVLKGAFLAHDRAHLDFMPTLALSTTQLVGAIGVAALAPGVLLFLLVVAFSRAFGLSVALFVFVTYFKPSVTVADLSARRAFFSGLPYGLHSVGSLVYLRLDILLLGALAGSRSVSMYGSVADPLVSLTSGIQALNSAFAPSLSRAFGVASSRFYRLVQTMLVLDVSAGVLLASVVFLGAERIVSVAFGSDFAPAVGVLRILSAVIVFRFVNNGLGTWLTAAGRQWQRAKIVLCIAVLNVGLNILTIPIWGYWAAAWSTVASETIQFILLLWYLRGEVRDDVKSGPHRADRVYLSGGSNVSVS